MQVSMGATEIGQGADTVFSQMASETTGISFDKVFIVSTQDTDLTPFDTGAYASRQTYVSGMACKKCATELRHRILDYAAYMLNHDVTDLSKTVYADLVKESAGKLREALGLHPEDEVKEDMLDIVDSKIVVHGGDPVLFDVAVVADTAFLCIIVISYHCKRNCLPRTSNPGDHINHIRRIFHIKGIYDLSNLICTGNKFYRLLPKSQCKWIFSFHTYSSTSMFICIYLCLFVFFMFIYVYFNL